MKEKISKYFSNTTIPNDLPHVTQRGPAEHEVREQIIRAAGIHFRSFGYEKTTVSELARHIGFSKAYIYKFFSSKQAIGEAIASSCIKTLMDAAQIQLDQTAPADEKLTQFITSVTCNIKRLLFEEKKLYDIVTFAVIENWQCHQRLQNFIHDSIRKLVVEGQDCGLFAQDFSVENTCHSIYLALQSFLNPAMLVYNQDQDPNSVITLILRSLKS